MAQLVLSVTWLHCIQLDTIEGGKEGGWQQQRTQFATSRPHLYQYNCKLFFFVYKLLTGSHFNQPCQKRLSLQLYWENILNYNRHF
jgi:hypothetical protein